MSDDLARRVARAVRNPNWGNQTSLDDARIALDILEREVSGLRRGTLNPVKGVAA